MKTIFVFFILCFATNALKAQDYKYIYYLNEHMAPVSQKDAIIIGKGFMEQGNLHLDCYLTSNSLLFLKIDFADTTLQTYNGPYSSYNKDGKMLESGTYKNGLLEGTKEEWNEKGQLTDSLIYHDDKVFTEYKFSYRGDKRCYFEVKDSLADRLYSRAVDENDNLLKEVKFKGQKGILITYKNGVAQTDSIFTLEETEPSFPGGLFGWSNFLKQNLNPNIPIDNGAKAGIYTVVVHFLVNINGEISDIEPDTHLGYGMEEEVIRLIKKSPKWIPATQYGIKINAYKSQPATFVIGND
ncbi:MAG: hypothetical protein ABI091_25470 [Ferruginibacter sp.]